MIAYEGKNPFAFVSYSHFDTDTVFSIIQFLKTKMCRIWYDEGLHAGESWNKEIAEHLGKSSAVIVFLSASSIKSKYVFMEINYAVSKGKTIIPVMLEKTDLPCELELLLSATHYLHVSGNDSVSEIGSLLFDQLPKDIVSLEQNPFLIYSGYSFFLKTQNVKREEYLAKSVCSVVCVNEAGEEYELLQLKRLAPYEAAYSLSSIESFKDYFYSGKIKGSFQMNLKGQFFLEYPLDGPDIDVLLICVLRVPRHGLPTVKVVDYQYLEILSSDDPEDLEDLDELREKRYTIAIKKYLESILYL